ncbi:MAG: hypothetical protein ABIG20_04150 [archaeon]
MNKAILIVIILILIALFAWSPWITADYAEARVTNKFNDTWMGVMDGCGFYNEATGRMEPKTITSSKTAFGRSVEIGYPCSWTPKYPELETETVFVSPLGTVHGMRGL